MIKEYYSLYYQKFDSKVTYVDIESMITKSGLTEQIFISDISDLDPGETIKLFGDVIKAERIREYDDSPRPAVVHLFVDKEGKFTLILSIFECKETSEFCRKVMTAFQIDDVKVTPVSLFGQEKSNRYESVAYWNEAIPCFNAYEVKERLPYASYERQTERYYLDGDLKDMVLAVIGAGRKSIKSILFAVWGRICSVTIKRNYVFLEDIHEGGILGRVPIFYDGTLTVEKQYESMVNQLVKAETFDMCDYDKLESFANGRLERRTLMSLEINSDKKYDQFLRRVKENTLYKFNPREFSGSPILVRYNIGKEEISLTYELDGNYFEGVNVEDLHLLFCKTLKAAILGEEIDINASIYQYHKETTTRLKIRDIKARLLGKIKLFNGYTEQEYKDLADKVDIVHKDSRQEAISQNYKCNKLFIVVSGRIEVDGIDKKCFLRPLLMLKDGDVMGVEALLSNSRSNNLYQVFSDEAVLISMDVEVFNGECKKHPELMNRLLEIQTERMNKFAKLWMMG